MKTCLNCAHIAGPAGKPGNTGATGEPGPINAVHNSTDDDDDCHGLRGELCCIDNSQSVSKEVICTRTLKTTDAREAY